MSGKVISIGSRKAPSVVALLEELLEEAKQGKVSGIAVAALYAGDQVVERYASASTGVFQLIAGLRVVEHRLLQDEVEW